MSTSIYTVYLTINLINLNYYIGVHKVNHRQYFGSGVAIKRAIKKYGIENFTQRILFSTHSEIEAYNIEAKLVTEEFISRPDTYNMVIGGGIPPSRKGFKNSEKQKQAIIKYNQERTISKETKKKMSDAQSGKCKTKQQKENMSISQKNRWTTKYIWVNNKYQSKRVKESKLNDFLTNGWILGRKL